MVDASKYLNDLACSKDVLQVILFDDDSVEAHFKDGSSVHLSPCGSCYQFVRGHMDSFAASEMHKNVLRQRCCFATSETKSKVEFAIFWRNHFAQRPYIPMNFQHLYGDMVRSHKDITSYTWPDHRELNSSLKNASRVVSISANDDLAKLEVSKNGNFCEVTHLVKVTPSSLCFASKDISNSSDSLETSSELNSTTRKYVGMKHIFPTSACPVYWKYPLSVAMQSINGDKDSIQLLNSNHAPQPISTICKKQFSHVWRISAEACSTGLYVPSNTDFAESKNSSIKLMKSVWSNKVMYWIFNNNSKSRKGKVGLEAWLPDGSILTSARKSANYYYTHVIFDAANPNVIKIERTYSTTALPSESALKTVILRAIRLQSYNEQLLTEVNLTTNQRYCWQDDLCGFGNLSINDELVENRLENLFENADIPNLGRFSAANGSVQIVFMDGTTMYISLSQQQLTALAKSTAELSSIGCRMLFENGQYMECTSITQPDSHFSGYLKPACDWLTWLAKSKKQRLDSLFYSDTIFSREKLFQIDSELEKINRFNFLLEKSSFNSTASAEESLNTSTKKNCSVSSDRSTHNNSSSNLYCLNSSVPFEISNVLKDTSQAINDIDSLIKSLRS